MAVFRLRIGPHPSGRRQPSFSTHALHSIRSFGSLDTFENEKSLALSVT
jgi:hypothetical protein